MSLITIKTEALQAALEAMLPVVPSKPTRDILKGLKFEAKQGRPDSLTIYATDLERYASYSVQDPTQFLVGTEGSFVVPAVILGSYVKALGEPEVTLLVTPQNTLKLSAGNTSEFEVGILDIDDFPTFPSVSGVDYVEVEAAALRFGLERVLFAVADKGHPKWGALSAVNLELENDKLSLIGTDQHRASISTITINSSVNQKKSLLVAGSALEIVSKIFNEKIKLILDNPNVLMLVSGRLTMYIRLISSRFPPVRNFIPKHPNKVSVESKPLLRELKKVNLATDKFSAIKICLRKDKIILTARTKEEKKSAKAECPITNAGPDIDFTINCNYLMEVLKVGDSFDLSYNRNNQPLMLQTSGFEHVIVPQETR